MRTLKMKSAAWGGGLLMVLFVAGCSASPSTRTAEPAPANPPTAVVVPTTPSEEPPPPATEEPADTAAPVEESAAAMSVSPNVSTFASGFLAPRGLKFGPDGYLYVAEGGVGGETETMGTCEGFTSMFAPFHIGMSARVSRVDADGNRTTVVENLPSFQDQFGDVIGVSDTLFIDDTLYAIVSGGGCSRGFEDFPASVVEVLDDGTVKAVADLSDFYTNHPAAAGNEADFEPDGTANAIVEHDGSLYILNANHGGLDVVTLDGQIRRLLDFTATEGHVTPDTMVLRDGNFYIGTLSKFPIVPGTAKVYMVTPDGDLSVYAEGLTAVVSIAFDEDGRLYALEASNVEAEYPPPGAGRVVRIGESGELEEIATGLSFPSGMVFGPDGELYVSHFSYGGDPANGEIVRIDVP
jgi:glucose/arabinose dehydrogenase